MEYIILGISFIVSMAIIWFMFSKLTPDNVPANLAGHFAGVLKLAISIVVSIYVALFVLQILFG